LQLTSLASGSLHVVLLPLQDGTVPYVVSSGGGPGMMEAANRGASVVPGGVSMGLGISLPHEHGLNQYITPELGGMFHYFWARSEWLHACTHFACQACSRAAPIMQ
jgi:predicted Rossmann-fold nucleotide-binding protein